MTGTTVRLYSLDPCVKYFSLQVTVRTKQLFVD